MRSVLTREDTILAWGTVATTADATCTGDTEIDCRNASQIAIQIEAGPTTAAGGTTYGSDSFDVNIYSRSKDATTYDTVPYVTALAAASSGIVQSKVITPGPAYMKLRVKNNSTSKQLKPRIVVQIAA